jgi:small subunit ribosomal protein S4
MQLLELRLDNVVFRSLFALSRNQARQFVRHGMTFINGRRVNIPSYLVKEGEVIELKVKDKMKALIKEHLELSAKERSVPTWLTVDKENLTITVSRLPEKEDIVIAVNEQLIIELYSK